MQASTVLMAAVGFALLWHSEPGKITRAVDSLVSYWEKLDTSFLERCIIHEASCYLEGDYCIYQTGKELAITILTDTTERSPTFSMHPFENMQDTDEPYSLCYLFLPEADNSESAWNMLLNRTPRALAWKRIGHGASYQRLLGFDFSVHNIQRRIKAKSPARHHYFIIHRTSENIVFSFDDFTGNLPVKNLSPLAIHLVIKMLLNSHSTLVMGRLGRYDGNIMTWVKANNNKLIDRTIRYADLLLQRKGVVATYERIASACFELMDTIPQDQSLVHAVVNKLSSTSSSYT
jgi:N-acetylmuramic acid 6-phosphate etherase